MLWWLGQFVQSTTRDAGDPGQVRNLTAVHSNLFTQPPGPRGNQPDRAWARPPMLIFAAKKLSTGANVQMEDSAYPFCPRSYDRAVAPGGYAGPESGW